MRTVVCGGLYLLGGNCPVAFVGCALYLVALINPISKVFVLSSMSGDMDERQLRLLALRSSVVALVILLAFAVVGNVILTTVFHVTLYAFQIVGGLVLFFVGFKALSHGTFYEDLDRKAVADLALVPLASPMIAGPATLTAAISFPAQYGMLYSMLAMVLAVGVNLVVMLFSRTIGRALQAHNLMGALIRITGMIVATIAVQMVLTGVAAWYLTLQPVS